MKTLIIFGLLGALVYTVKKFDAKVNCLNPEDFKKWLEAKRKTDPLVDKKYQEYLAYAEKMKPTGWKVLPFVLYYEGQK